MDWCSGRLLGLLATLAVPAICHGEDKNGSYGVALQPFSLGAPIRRAKPVQVAYYAPRTQAVIAQPPYEGQEEAELIPPPFATGPTVNNSHAVVHNGVAYAPAGAPANVKRAIWAVNTLRRKPYVWGGGHHSFDDYGYDCSGAVSYALHYAGVLQTPLPSNDFLRYGERGRGRWITIYSRPGHTFAVIAGLRLDTTDLRYGGDVGPRWYADARDTRGFAARHPIGM